MKRRNFIGSLAAASVAAQTAKTSAENTKWDYIVVGAGTAGLPAAIFASRRGAKVLLIDAAESVGGTLHLANGQISAGGSSLQESKGIVDSPDAHFADIMRMTEGLADEDIVRRTVDLAPDTINWLLDNGLKPIDGHPVTGSSPGRPTYTTARYLWGEGEGRDILAVVLKELQPEIDSGRVVTQLQTRVDSLIQNDEGAIQGVKAICDGELLEFHGQHIIISTGGYAMNPELFEKLLQEPAYASGSYPSNQGKGLELATSVGGVLRGRQLHRAGTGNILSSEEFPAKPYARFNTDPLQRPPWEIWVNNEGKRFIREDEPMNEFRAAALAKQSRFRYAIIFDDQILKSAPTGFAKWTDDKVLEHFNSHPMFHKANSIRELAEKAGINAKNLERTITKYNNSVRSGQDELKRSYLPRPINSGPYYAIIHLGSSATSSIGISVDKNLRVLNKRNQPIPNLYAAGEVLGSGATLGSVFTPGMMLTPALALGRWLGQTLPV